MRRWTVACALGVTMVVSACTTTGTKPGHPVTVVTQGGGTAGAVTPTPGGTPAAATPTAGTHSASVGRASATNLANPTGAQSGAGLPATALGGTGQVLAGLAPGAPIKLGTWLVDTTAACAQLGAKADCSDDTPYAKAVAAYVNKHGGIAGHPIDPVIYVSDGLEGETWAALAQDACSALIEDDHVFAVVATYVGGRSEFASCAAQHHTPVDDTGYWPFDQQDYSALDPYLYQTNKAAPEAWTKAYVNGLVTEGFFTPGAKIALVRFDAPEFATVTNQVIKPLLAQHGLALKDEITVPTPQSASDLGGMSAQLSNTILRLRSDGIDHVMFFELGSEMSYFFFPLAESQGYRPRYALSSYQDPSLLVNNVPLNQLHNAVGVGFEPGLDVGKISDLPSPASTACKDLFNNVGLNGGSGRSVYCDFFFFMQAALSRAPTLTADGLRQAVDSLGTSFQASSNLGTRFGPGDYAGAAVYRQMAFNDACGCFKYGPELPQ